MKVLDGIQWILTDIEGTTTEVSFVYDILFPYFRAHMDQWKIVDSDPMNQVLEQTRVLVIEEQSINLTSKEALFEQLRQWSNEDRKVTPLKTFQGMVWEQGFKSGAIKGHVYPDVKPALEQWTSMGIKLAIFSSGSIAAQKQLFGFSIEGDLTPYFSAFFDTTTGMKRDEQTYQLIVEQLQAPANCVLFLSDISQELEAAHAAGIRTLQLVRPGTEANWSWCVAGFSEIQ
ncbi:MAG: acireductone synthase [Crocinitomicaceae bacterium]|nr:acireductone synthase [Crocinitomicaceae bacterium]